MAYKGIQKLPLICAAATELVRYRFVDITKSTLTAAYSAAGSTPDGVTLAGAGADSASSAYIVTVQPMSDMTETFFITLAGTVARGDELFATTSGEAITATHDNIVDRGKQASAPGSPTAGDKHILPAAGWSAAHTNAIAVYTTAWAYTDVDATTNVGIVCFVVDEGRYVQWSGTAWVAINVAGYADEAGSDGQTIAAYKEPSGATKVSGYNIKTCARVVTGGTSATLAIKDVNIAASDEIFCGMIEQAGTVYVIDAVPTAGTLTVTFSAAVNAADIFNYMAVAPYGATD